MQAAWGSIEHGFDRRQPETTRGQLRFVTAFGIQYPGLLAERWYFFAQANHPQNLSYQAVS